MKQRLHGANTQIATLVEMLRLRAGQWPDKLAYRFLMEEKGEEVCWNYAQLDARARAIAARLQELGAPGERVLLLYPPGLDYIAAFFGALYAGAVAVPAYPPRANKPMPRVQAIAADCQAHVVLTTAGVLADSQRRIEQTPDLAALQWISTDDLPLALADQWQEPESHDRTLAFLQYTSGSTGDPKGVMVSHGNLLHNLEMIHRGFHIDPRGMGITWLPMYHDMGLIGGILGPMFAGGPATLMSPVSFLQRPASWLQAITRFQGTISGAPNFAYELCVEKVADDLLDSLDLSTWQTAFTGAEPIRAETLRRFAQKFARCGFKPDIFYPCFGLAEGTLISTGGDGPAVPVTHTIRRAALEQNRVEPATPGDDGSQTLVGCGNALLGQRLQIVNPETLAACPPDIVGEIWVQGPSMAQGYWNRPAETQHTFQAHLSDGDGPFMRTGDLGYLHDGQLYVTGRLKDLIIIRGRNHYPQDIERTVEQSHPALRVDSGAAFSTDIDGEERLIVVQEVEREHRKPNVEEIVAAVRAAVARQHDLQLHAIALVKTMTIPKTSSGKIKRRETRAEFLVGNLTLVGQWTATETSPTSRVARDALPPHAPLQPAQSARSRDTITAWLITEIAKRLSVPEQQFDITAPFDRYGLDSLAAVTLSGDLEQWLGRELSPTLVYEYSTIEALAGYLAADSQTPEVAATRRKTDEEPIAIIGLGCRFPGGANDHESFWRLLHEGVDCIREIPSDRWNAAELYDPDPAAPGKMITRWGGFISDVDQFDPQFFGIAPREAQSMDPQQRLFLEVCWEALENAALPIDRLAGTQTGVFMGICSSDYSHLLHEAGDRTRINAYTGTGNAFSVASGRVSYVLGVHGPNFPVDTACSSSLVAVHLAMQSLRAGECRTALAGGVNLLLSPDSMIYFSKVQAMSPDGRCMTFDARANGYVRGEGCGVVALKCLSDALADGDRVLAVIRGSAVNHDGRSNGLTAPNGSAQEAVLRKALSAAGVDARDVQYVEAHGTGTSLGDPIEVRALGSVLSKGRAAAEPLVLGSVKTNIGHLEAAAGVAGLIKVVLSLVHEEIPPHLHFQQLNPHIPQDLIALEIPTQPRSWKRGAKRRIAGISSFGFSGTNAHLIVEEGPPEAAVVNERERPLHLVTLSAKTPEALAELGRRYAKVDAPLADLAFTANTGRAQFAERAAVVAESCAELKQRLEGLTAGQGGTSLRGVRPKVAMLFTGQGAQVPGMGKRLYETQPTFRRVLEECDALLKPHLERPLLSVLYPQVGESSPIDATAYTQPCLFAFEYALAQLWRSWGIEPAVVLGHSVGEYVAACVAGVMSLEEALTLIATRGRLMQALPAGGQMAAVFATPARVEAAIAPYADRVSIAAYNGPQNVVISGEGVAVQKILTALEREEIKATRLSVSHAFHSPLMEPMLAEFERVAGGVKYQSPKLRVISNLTGEPATGDQLVSAAYWREHVRRPVQFARSIETLAASEIALWLEIGPSPTLLSMARRFVVPPSGGAIRYLPSLRPGRDDWLTMLESLATLYVEGVEVDWSGFDRDYQRKKVWLPTYPFQRQRYWLETSPSRNAALPATSAAVGHPLLGAKLRCASQDTIFEVQLSTAALPYLADHCVYDHAILPAAAYLEMAVAAAARVLNTSHIALEKVRISEPLFVSEEPTTVQVIVSPGTPLTFQIASEHQDIWTVHATGQCSLLAQREDGGSLDAAILPEQISKSVYYQRLHEQGLQYGPRFQGIEELSRRDGEAVGQLRLASPAHAEYRLHPALLDACFQLLGAAVPSGSLDHMAYVPVGLERLEVHVDKLPDTEALLCQATTRAAPRTNAPLFTGDLRLKDQQGRLLVEISGLTLARAPRELLLKDAPRSEASAQGDDWLYELSWQAVNRPAAVENGTTSGPWLIVPDAGGLSAALASQLELRGERVIVAPASDDDLRRVLEEASPRGVIYLRGLDAPAASDNNEPSYADLAAAQERSLGGLLRLVQALAGSRLATKPRLWLATRGAVAVQASGGRKPPGGVHFDLANSSLWGLARVVALEHADLRPVRIDLDPAADRENLDALLSELHHTDREDQLAYRAGTRYAERLTRLHSAATSATDPLAVSQGATADVRLEIPHRGVLDNLALRPLTRRPPGRGEVEIAVRATGLNFRDVLNVLGLYPGDPGPLGGECAGVIAAVGEGVTELAIGDEVLGIASGSFATYVTTPASLVVKKPANLSFAQAATVPITFLTAHYALHELAGMRRGDRVLIQAAAGGVGLAAVQLARRAGAEIFGTAGSPAKRAYLIEQGVQESHLFNSRNVEFAAGIQQRTGGAGVRMVLNSLAGEFIPKGLSLVAPGGHFLEIGKADLWTAERVAAVNKQARYTAIALDQMVVEDPARVGRMLRELMPLFATGELVPLRHEEFPLEDAASAFRYMAQAKHIGKVVVTLSRVARDALAPPTSRIHPHASYLITGGLGALGLKTAAWLAEQGAKHLVLVGRSAPSDEARQALDQLRERGVTVNPVQADLSSAADVRRVLKPIQPPLKGIIHASGVLDDGVLVNLDWPRFQRVLAPKLAAGWHLHRETQDLELDFFVMYSSMASLLGSPGQGNYAAANAFLDGLAWHRRLRGLPATSINWGPWADSGMAATRSQSDQRRWTAQGITPLPTPTAFRLLDQLLQLPTTQPAVLPIDWTQLLRPFAQGAVPPLFEHVVAGSHGAPTPTAELRKRLEQTPAYERRELLVSQLQANVAKVLALADGRAIDPRQPLGELGLDSLMAVELHNRLAMELGVNLPTTILFDYPTIDALAGYLLRDALMLDTGELPTAPPQAVDELAQLDDLSEQEVDALLEEELASLDQLLEGTPE